MAELYTSDDSATEIEDYVPRDNEPISFDSFETKQEYIEIKEDDKFEQDELFFVEITGAAVGNGINRVAIKITDNDREF